MKVWKKINKWFINISISLLAIVFVADAVNIDDVIFYKYNIMHTECPFDTSDNSGYSSDSYSIQNRCLHQNISKTTYKISKMIYDEDSPTIRNEFNSSDEHYYFPFISNQDIFSGSQSIISKFLFIIYCSLLN